MCVVFEVMQSPTCRVFECCCLLFDLLGVASNVGIMKMSLCGIPHLVFTRGRASIVLAFSNWCICTTTGTKAAQQVSLPYAFRIAVKLEGVVMDGPVIVSGAAMHTRPLPLACVVLIGPGPSASIPLTLMAV